MPNYLDLRPDLYPSKLTHSPLPQLDIDVARVLQDPLDMTQDIIFGAVNQLLGWIDEATGLNFLDWAKLLEDQLSPEGAVELLTKLTAFLNPASLQDLINGLNIFTPILTSDNAGTFLAQLIPGLDATKIVSGLFPQDMVEGLEEDLQNVWDAVASGDVQGVIDAILKIVGFTPGTGTTTDVDRFFTDLLGMLALPNLTASGFDPVAAVMKFITDMIQPTNLLLDPASPLNATNLFNLIQTNLLGLIPVSAIGDIASNLLVNPMFENLEAIDSTTFTWDPTTAHSSIGGSAKVVADGGGSKDLLSNLIQVTPGQVINLSAWVKYTNVTGSGTPIQLGVTNYLHGSAVGQPVIVQQGLTPPTSDWRNLVGPYTIPDNVDAIRMRMTLAPTASAGTVWWSDTSLGKTGLMPQNLVNQLPEKLTDLTNDIAGAINDIISKVAQGDFDDLMNTLGGDLNQIDDRLKSFLDGLSPLNGSNVQIGSIADAFVPGVGTTINNLITKLFGISTDSTDPSVSAEALAHITDVLTGLTGQVDKLTIRATSGTTGGDDFERSASNLGSNWSVTYPTGSGGTMRTDGHNAVFSKSGISARVAVCRFVPLTTATDFQVWSASINNSPEQPLLSGLTGSPAYNDVLGRMSSDNRNFIRFRIGAGHCWLSRVVNGIEQTMWDQPYDGPPVGPGSSLTLQCGRSGNARYFQGRHNGLGVIEIGETGTASMLGTDFRQGGFGGLAGAWPGFLSQSAFGGVRMFNGGDQ